MNANEYVKTLNIGWNLGNTLDSRSRGGKSNLTLQEQETQWYNPPTTAEMIQKVHSAGFDIFRVPTTWCKQFDEEFNIAPEWMARVNEVVDYGINCGMTVILNLHHENWHFPSEENFPKASEIMKKVWTQIANNFANYDNKLIFEAMNEPRKEKTEVEWTGGDEEGRRVVMKLNQIFVDTVRGTGGNNASRMLLVPNYAASCFEVAMQDFVMPTGENIIMSLHGYNPYEFALGDDHSINVFTSEHEKDIVELFARIDKYFLSKGIPVIMGECGARRKRDNETERAKWAAFYSKTARSHGVPCVWWDNGYLEGDDKTEVFGLLNRRTVEWGYPEIAKAFVEGGKK